MKENIEKLNPHNCVGCRSCEQSCPQKCITMINDSEGFLYPEVSGKDCVSCGLCIRHCPILSDTRTCFDTDSQKIYAMQLKDLRVLKNSSSGGVFAGIAKNVLKSGGTAFGCALDNMLQARHIPVTNVDDLPLLQGSKYVASDTGETYKQVKILLDQNMPVLYSGTPCQIAGLNAFLENKPDNLLTMDIVCHGTPSQKLFNKYLDWLGKRNHGRIIYYGFRDKDVAGWSCGGKAKTKTKTKTKTIEGICDPYYASFLRGETYRPSCYNCIFAGMNRPGDLTGGDFWGIEIFYPEFDKREGVSICIVNSKRGEAVFNEIKQEYEYFPVSEEEIQDKNENLIHPTFRPVCRNTIYNGIDKTPVKLYFKNNFRYVSYFNIKLKKLLFKIAGKSTYTKIKKILSIYRCFKADQV
jgi:coenzyme F420-reducing hydrogenase beta subunit